MTRCNNQPPATQTAPRTSAVAPCTTATPACVEWVTLGGGPGRSMIYRTYSLEAPNERVTRALIMIHGTNRNADHYFDTAKAAAFLAGAIDDAVVIAPRIVCGTDPLEPNEINWPCGGDSWRSGGMSTTHPALSSFDIVDEILRKLARKSVFPNIKARYVPWIERGVGSVRVTQEPTYRACHAVPRPAS